MNHTLTMTELRRTQAAAQNSLMFLPNARFPTPALRRLRLEASMTMKGWCALCGRVNHTTSSWLEFSGCKGQEHAPQLLGKSSHGLPRKELIHTGTRTDPPVTEKHKTTHTHSYRYTQTYTHSQRHTTTHTDIDIYTDVYTQKYAHNHIYICKLATHTH